jgi:hypothetical protein
MIVTWSYHHTKIVDVKLGEFFVPHISRFKERFAKRQKGNEAVFLIANSHISA